MSVFENYGREASDLEREITRKGIALGIDWNDAAAVDELARAALDFKPGAHAYPHDNPRERARQELFGLAQLMLQVMTESAEEKMLTHGGPVWKIFGRALWRVWQTSQGTKS
jgi:hypothetical protein